MAPHPLVVVALLLCPASACYPRSGGSLSCRYNLHRSIRCEWITEHTDRCSLRAETSREVHKGMKYVQKLPSSCELEPVGTSRLRTCSLLFQKDSRIKTFHVLSLNLSCVHTPQLLVTLFQPFCYVKLDALMPPMVNESSLIWAPVQGRDPQYEIQWTPQGLSWAHTRLHQFDCSSQCTEELQEDALVLGQRYEARVRGRVTPEPMGLSEWSEWSPTVSWTSAVGRTQKTPQDGAWLWTLASVGTCSLIVVLLWVSRMQWVRVMKVVKGAPQGSLVPCVLKGGWRPPLFSLDNYLTFFKPLDIIAAVELLPADSKSCHDCFGPTNELSSSPASRFNLSSFSNPIYSETNDPPEDTELASCPELDLLLLLSAAQQSSGMPVVCEYEKVEAMDARGPGGDRSRLMSVDSGVSSGEEVSQEIIPLVSQHPDGSEHSVVGCSPA